MSSASLSEWFASSQGRYVLHWEQTSVDAIVSDVFGYNALQIGLPNHDLLQANRIAHRFVSDQALGSGAAVFAEPQQLPFASSSVDLVLLPHVLEFSRNPHQILREVERILVPEGSVVITGFNPFSLFGVRRAFSRSRSVFPWCGHYFSAPRLRDWLTLLGFEPQAGVFGCFAPPVRTEKWQARWKFMERAGGRWWPVCGGAFVLHGVKRVHGVRLITPNWRGQTVTSKGLAPIARRRRSLASTAQKINEQEEI